ncbi:unnamed protein product [Peniophora sp. CBMAI 1063]|nr:unnamed protein product [Peniophora sp. CBMAI 1063]
MSSLAHTVETQASHPQDDGTSNGRSIQLLPAELLVEIFLCVNAMTMTALVEDAEWNDFRPENPAPSSAFTEGPPPCWYLSHVCQRWRQLAIQCSALWSNLPRRSPEWSRICLERCAKAPVHLCIEAWAGTKLYDEFDQSHMYPFITRAHTIRMDYIRRGGLLGWNTWPDDRRMMDILQALTLHGTPDLRILELKHRLDGSHRVRTPMALPDLNHGQTLSKLHTILLEGFTLPRDVPTDALFSSSITSLGLANCLMWRNLDEMTQVLLAMPFLEDLTYINFEMSTRPLTPLPPTSSLRSISLPRINHLDLEADAQEVASIFALLEIPTGPDVWLMIMHTDYTEMHIQEGGPSGIGPYMDLAASAVQAHFSAMPDKAFIYPRVGLFYNWINGYLSDSDEESTVSVQMPYTGPHEARVASFLTYFQLPVFSRTTRLHIENMLDGFSVAELACHFMEVRDLQLHNEAAVVFWGGLTGTAVNDSQPASEPCKPFPALARIRIAGFDFVKWPGTCVDETNVPHDFAALLAEALCVAYTPLETFEHVAFTGCTMREDDGGLFEQMLGVERVRIEDVGTLAAT